MEALKKEVEDHDIRLRRLEEEVAENRKEWKVISIMNALLSEIKEATARTEENIKELRKDIEFDKKEIEKLKKQRDDDHFIKPLGKRDKLVDSVLSGTLMLVVGAIIGAILANIGL